MVRTLSARQLVLSAAACMGVALSAGLAVAQDAQTAPEVSVDQYRLILQEIADRKTILAQREFYISQQQAEIDSMTGLIEEISSVDASAELMPLVQTMVAELEKVMTSDLPFRVERRFALLDDLRADMQGEDVVISDIYRRAMSLYGQEMTYGLQVGSYTGQNPMPDRQGQRFRACQENPESAVCDLNKEQATALKTGALIEDLEDQLYDGNYIHFGRLALLYLERDSSEGYRYNQDSGAWDQMSNSELLGLRQNVRIARGESAISTMTAPIRVGEAGADAS